jgi:hypothetical protein
MSHSGLCKLQTTAWWRPQEANMRRFKLALSNMLQKSGNEQS